MKKDFRPKQRDEILKALQHRFEKNMNRQKLDVVNKTRSNPESFRGWRGQFTPEFLSESRAALLSSKP